MTEEKQIEEMRKDLVEIFYEEYEKRRIITADFTAIKMNAKGYRKQSENTVEVVRCKDCEYWTEVSFDAITEWRWGECRKPLGDYRDCDTAEHDFCSYGEAKMKGGAE